MADWYITGDGMTARAVTFVEPGRVEITEFEPPTPGPAEVLVETIVSAISAGTELLLYRGHMPDGVPVDPTLESFEGTFGYPMRYGYAAVGTVTTIGADVSPEWLDRTVLGFTPHASHFVARPESIHQIPSSISAGTAALAPFLETAVGICMDARPTLGERVVVFGQGPIGLLTTMVLARYPLETLQTVEPVSNRRHLSEQVGATASHRPDDLDVLRSSLDEPIDGADLVIELSGDPDSLDDALSVAGFDARIVIGSWYGNRPAILDLGGRFHRDRIDVVSSQVSTIDSSLQGRWTKERRFDVVWSLLSTLETAPLITDRFSIHDAASAYDRLDSAPDQTIQVLLTYDSV